jgi:hypothetical protein
MDQSFLEEKYTWCDDHVMCHARLTMYTGDVHMRTVAWL